MNETVFPPVHVMAERSWGTEECLVLAKGKYMMKRLTIKKGCKGGLQYHRVKDECGYILKGRLRVFFDDGSGGLISVEKGPGDFFHFPPGLTHQEEAIEECVILEMTTAHANDRVRMEKTYGIIEPNQGLPTTSLNEIQYL